MFKLSLLVLLAVHCNCQRIIDLSGNNAKTIQTYHTSSPIRTISGYSTLGDISTIGGIRSISPYSSIAVSPYSSLSGYYGLNHGLRSVNIAPSSYGYHPFARGLQSYTVAARPAIQTLALQQPASIAVAQPALAVAQPAFAVAQPAYAVAQPAIAIAARPQLTVDVRPQVFAAQHVNQPVNAAIHQIGRTVEYKSIPHQEQPMTPQFVEVEPSDNPVHIHFKSRSSSVRVSQEHIPGEQGTIEQTSSQEDPSKVIHEVVKPVIQEVREVIQPYRQLTQEIQPVVENVHSVVSKGETERAQLSIEPQIIRQHMAVQQVRPAQVAVQQIEEEQPISYAVKEIAVPQVEYQTVQQIVPQVQTVQQVVPQVQTVQQIVPQIQYQTVKQMVPHVKAVRPALASFSTLEHPISAVKTVRISQPAIHMMNSGLGRVMSFQQPAQAFRTEFRDQDLDFSRKMEQELDQQILDNKKYF